MMTGFATLAFRRTRFRRCSLENEIIFCFIVYIAYLLFGLWALFNARDHILATAKFKFAPGWILGRPRDQFNRELEDFTLFVQTNWAWYVLHLVVSVVVRKWWPCRQSCGYIFACAMVLMLTFRAISIAVILALLLSYYAIAQQYSKTLTWLLSVLWIAGINLIKHSEYWKDTLSDVEFSKLFLILSWSLLRCCSFNLDLIGVKMTSAHRNEVLGYSLENFLGYTLYFPNLVHGPFWAYPRYLAFHQVQQYSNDVRSRSLVLACEILRAAFLWLFLQVVLHFLYIHYFALDISAVKLVRPAFGQHAIGCFMGQFFCLYYMVSYGVAIAFARFDGLDPPNRPRCIAHIHYYSDMWKYFDEGLYEFLFRHIYAELCSRQSSVGIKLLATAGTFSFVFVLHGFYAFVFIWSVLNFVCLVAEKCFKVLMFSHAYTTWANKRLGVRGGQRLRALLGAQIFMPAALANVYFISGGKVGISLMRGLYMNGVWNFIALSICSYCFFQCIDALFNKKKNNT